MVERVVITDTLDAGDSGYYEYEMVETVVITKTRYGEDSG